jgi:hypothetical protein
MMTWLETLSDVRLYYAAGAIGLLLLFRRFFWKYQHNGNYQSAANAFWGTFVCATMANGWKFLAVVLFYLAAVDGTIVAIVRAIFH